MHKMIPEERRNKIVEYISSKGTVTIPEISKKFEIAEITVRRDFDTLSKLGVIKKVYGGAAIKSNFFQEPFFLERINDNREEKRRIAAEAVKRISDNSTILLESGTTCLELARLLGQKKNINVVTAAPHIVNILCNLKRENKFNGEILCCGGVWRGEPDDIFIGSQAINFFDSIRIGTAFFGIVAINLKDGWMAPSSFEAELTKKIVSLAEKVIGITHHSKFNRISFTKIGLVSLFDEIITDTGLSKEDIEKYQKEVKITIC
ncbi:MAG: hypothetical protein COT09_00845 [Candidatus Hydromicrobium americanum]|nr:MAG: hypothetical protein COT09_00845 [Candidatus Hydromicrobium americanum]